LQHDELANLDPAAPNRLMIKPHAGTGGLGIRSMVGHEIGSAKSPLQPGEYLQQRIAGRPIGVNFISRCRDGSYQANLLAAFVGLTHRKNPQHRWLYGGSIGPLRSHDAVASELQKKLARLGDRIAQRFELVGLFNVDLILTPDRSLTMLEINPRYSASMELMPAAGHLIDCHIAAYQETAGHIDRHQADKRFAAIERPTGEKSYKPACKRIVYATRPTRFNVSVEKLHQVVRNLYQAHAIEVTFHDIPSTDELIPSGYPILTIIAKPQNADIPLPAKNLLRQSGRIAARIRRMLG
jgi:predicted ATP-grasp superfamily ATP-dependent carboligase